MKNRHGQIYSFAKIGDDAYTITGDLQCWRYGGREGQNGIDLSDLGFVDPSGGPFIGIGSIIEGRRVRRISADGHQITFEVE